jgi:hypothetical protein
VALPSFIGNNVLWPGNAVPMGVCNIDPSSGLVYSPGCANYVPISTAGTTTIAAGGGLYYGANAISAGTGFTYIPYDIVTAGTTTNQLAAIGTASTGVFGAAGPTGMGIRFFGTLIVVTAGTPGAVNCLWD